MHSQALLRMKQGVHKSCHTYKKVMHNKSCMCVPWIILAVLHSYVGHDLVYTCDMTYAAVFHAKKSVFMHMCEISDLFVRHDSFICGLWLIHTHDMTHIYLTSCEEEFVHVYVWNDWMIYVPWLIRMWSMTHSFIRVTRLIYALLHAKRSLFMYICEMTYLYVCHDSFLRGPWLIPTCDMTHTCLTSCEEEHIHAYMCHDLLICVPWLIHMCHGTYEWLIRKLDLLSPWSDDMCEMTHSYVPWHICDIT